MTETVWLLLGLEESHGEYSEYPKGVYETKAQAKRALDNMSVGTYGRIVNLMYHREGEQNE